ncbi:MAG: hypothetical protein ABIJ57_17245 [Pseudomonadota bacterium]
MSISKKDWEDYKKPTEEKMDALVQFLRESEAERNTARKLTIQDHKKDCGFGRYVVRGDGETIYGGNDLEAAIEAIAMHYLEMEG